MSPPILKITEIPFCRAMELSDINTSPEQKRESAQAVASIYGKEGVLSLWLLQGFYDPVDIVPNGVTPATSWWLAKDNSWTPLVQTMLANIDDMDLAISYLQMATCVPRVATDIVWGMNGRANETFMPGDISKPSNLHATYVRQLAQKFFPQFPQLAEPTCKLYQEVVGNQSMMDDGAVSGLCYEHPMRAFADDEHAQHYLACVLPNSAVGQFPAHLVEFRFNKNEAWRMYEQIGLSLEDGYTIAKMKPLTPTDEHLTLPDDVSVETTS